MKKIFIFLMFFCFFISLVFALDLRITEVFVDGSDERVEISNTSSGDFVGSFTLSGVKSSLLGISNITIPEFTTLLVGDTLSMVSTPNILNILGGRGLSLGDTAGVDISLIDTASIVIDSFIVDQATVQSYDNTMTSFQKVYNGGGFDIIPTVPSFSVGVLHPSIANPGLLYYTSGNLWFPLVSSGTGSISSGSIDTGSSTTGNNLSGIVIDCSTVWSGVVVIDEIYQGDIYNDYIELLFLQSWTGSLIVSGSAVGSSFTLPSQGYQSNMRYIITSNSSGFHHVNNIIVVPNLLLGSGEIAIQDPLSTLSYYAYVDNTGQSVYFSNNNTCIQNIALAGNPSPGFDRQFLGYFNTQTITNTIIQTVTGSCTSGGYNTGVVDTTGTTITGLNTLSGGFNFHDVHISLIDYDPDGSDTNNERLGLMLFTGESLSLSGWSLGYDGKTYKFLSGMIVSGTEYIKTANFGFVNSRTICISLYYIGTIIDTVCYDPTVQESPVSPLVISTGDTVVLSGDDETFDYNNLQFDIISLVYDPEGSDTDRETVTIKFLGGTDVILLDNLRLRVGTTNKRIYGAMLSGQILTLIGNFQMPNTRSTCIALSYNEIIYDEYCYTPSVSTPSTSPSSQNTTSDTSLYTNRLIQLVTVGYDPEGSDTDRETVRLLMTGSQSPVDLSKLYLRFGTTKRYLNGMLYSDVQTIITGNYQMPNSKSTCVDLMEGSHIFDTYCYVPGEDEGLGTGDIQTGDIQPLVTGIDRKEYYSGLKLQRILPNPKDKDIKDFNEKFALYRGSGNGQTLTKHVKILIGKTSLSLSGRIFDGTEMVIASPKALTNQAACVRLLIDGDEIDTFCYPQAKEGLIYYHPRLQTGPQTIPSSLIASLDAQGLNLSDLLLKKSGKQICLTYKKVQIRCMNGGTTSTTAKNKALLTLGNAYIRKMSELVYAKEMDYVLMEQRRKAYHTLSDEIKGGNLGNLYFYGQSIKVTDIESYVTALYSIDEDEYLTDQLTHIFFGHQAVDNYYRQLYK